MDSLFLCEGLFRAVGRHFNAHAITCFELALLSGLGRLNCENCPVVKRGPKIKQDKNKKLHRQENKKHPKKQKNNDNFANLTKAETNNYKKYTHLAIYYKCTICLQVGSLLVL